MKMKVRSQVVRSFLVGLAAVVPIWVTVLVVSWLAGFVEATLGRVVSLALPQEWYWPGTGVLVGLVLILAIGWLLDRGPLRAAFEALDRGVEHVPAVRSIYGTARDLMLYLVGSKSNGRKQSFSKVAVVKVGDGKTKLVGLVTREDMTDLSGGLGLKETVMVYLPMSYQLGGYTIIVPRSAIELVDMSVEDAIRLTMTAGVSSESSVNGESRAAASRPSPAAPAERRAQG
jgi:uncharacterized membrane protein